MATRWPVVPGTIKLSGIEEYHAASDPGEARGVEMFGKRVTYTYQYQNVSYTNECARVAAGTPDASDEMLRKLMARYQDGATVEVRVNPANPAEATLDARGAGRIAYVRLSASRVMIPRDAIASFIADNTVAPCQGITEARASVATRTAATSSISPGPSAAAAGSAARARAIAERLKSPSPISSARETATPARAIPLRSS